MFAVVVAAVSYTALFIVIELASRKLKLHKELSRKLSHIIAGISAACLPLVMSFNNVMILSMLFLPVMILSKKKGLFTSIHNVKRKTYGEFYFPISIFICAWLFQDIHIFMFGVLVMGISDGLASLVGQKYGTKTYKLWQSKKSYVGSTVFFIATFLIGLLTIPYLGFALVPICALLTMAEAGLSGGSDNLVLPPAACLLAVIANNLM